MADAWQIFFSNLAKAKAAVDALKDSAKDAKSAVVDVKGTLDDGYYHDPKGTLGSDPKGTLITGGEDSVSLRRVLPFRGRLGMTGAGVSAEEMEQLAAATERAAASQDRLERSISKTQSAWKKAHDQKLTDQRNLIKSIKSQAGKGDQISEIIASFMASYIAALKGDSFSASRKVWIRAELEKWGAMWGLDVDSLDELFRRGMIE